MNVHRWKDRWLLMNSFFRSKVFRNGTYLYVLQFFNTVIPLLTLPYITKVIGIEQYGVLNKVLNYVLYMQAFVEYGFTLNGARKISLATSEEEINQIRSNIIYSKFLLLIISSVFAFGLMFFLKTAEQRQCLWLLFIIVASEVLAQTWFFQGMQSMIHITIVSVIGRSVSVLFIFLFVKNPSDLPLYCLFYSSTYFIIAFLGTIIAKLKFKCHFTKFSIGNILEEMKDAFYLFITSFSSKIFTIISVTVLSIFSSDIDIGGFSAIQKIPQIIVLAYIPLSQAIFPYVCKLYRENESKGVIFIRRFLIVISTGLVIGISILIIFRNFIIGLIYDTDYTAYTYLIIPLAAWLFFSVINNILGIQILVARGMKKQYSICFFAANAILVLLNFVFGYFYGPIGVSIATLVGEVTLTILCIIIIYKYKLLKNKNEINVIES